MRAPDVYRSISRRRRPDEVRNRLTAAEVLVFDAYRQYSACAADVTVLAAADTTPATSPDLTGNYDSGGTETRRLRAQLLANNAGGKCAMCGRGTATTLDHYLPKQLFPEFSVLPLNIVPSCWDCNHKKGFSYRRASAIFLHSYLDSVPHDVRFLFARVEVLDSAVAFEYWVDPPDELGALVDRIRDHFESLDLAAAYSVEALHEANERRQELRRLYEASDDDPEAIREYLWHEADSVAGDKGENHWRFVALDALAESADFCAGGFLS
jgi:5-methylcytosine-specific restriction endonuclease McrA